MLNLHLRPAQMFKSLSVVLVCCSLWWWWVVVMPIWLRPSDVFRVESGIIVKVVLSFVLGGPSLVGVYCGWQGLFRNDSATVKRLVGSYWLYLTLLLAAFLQRKLMSIKSDGFRDAFEVTAFLLLMVLSYIVATAAYVFFSRCLLRLLGLYCPSLPKSVPGWTVSLIAWQFWLIVIVMAASIFQADSFSNVSMRIAICASCTLLAASLNKWAARLAARQKATEEPPNPKGISDTRKREAG